MTPLTLRGYKMNVKVNARLPRTQEVYKDKIWRQGIHQISDGLGYKGVLMLNYSHS